ncbi:MAG TPA: CopG family ribbon-helix-helix protein [Rhizomicrobium sp.]|jgi:predicted transcriptional regulator|nr:CopG family ribbon-helix-helix protein [Rhizomicrobium sp.]
MKTGAKAKAVKSAPVSFRVPGDLATEVAALAQLLDRSKSWLFEQAVRDFVALQRWQLAAIDEGIAAADAGRFAAHEDVAAWVRSWGKADELPPPECG